jgi:hypothetical protein
MQTTRGDATVREDLVMRDSKTFGNLKQADIVPLDESTRNGGIVPSHELAGNYSEAEVGFRKSAGGLRRRSWIV